jgi:hypothetical protein
MTPADFGAADEPQEWALFPVDSQGRVGGDLFEARDDAPGVDRPRKGRAS